MKIWRRTDQIVSLWTLSRTTVIMTLLINILYPTRMKILDSENIDPNFLQ